MVALQQPFNVQQVEPFAGFDPIPEAWYPAIITNSEMKPTQANDGGYIQFIYEIVDGPHKGRKLFDNLNVFNKNQQTVEIAYRTLSAIGWCVGIFNIQDTTQLHNIPLMIHVVQAKNERDGGMTNKIRGYKDRNGQEPWKAGGGQMPQDQAPQQQPPMQGGWPQQQPMQQPPQQQPQGWPQQAQQPTQQMPQQGAAPWQQGAPQQPAQGGWPNGSGQPQQPAPMPAQGAPSGPSAGWQQGAAPTPPWQQR